MYIEAQGINKYNKLVLTQPFMIKAKSRYKNHENDQI